MSYIYNKISFFRIKLLFIVLISALSATAQKSNVESLQDKIDVAYGQQDKLSTTAAISSIAGDDINVPTSSLSNILSGKIAGLTTILKSGEPGNDAATLYVRGLSSYNKNNVLVYVDGFQSSFEHLNTLEIESIAVLKDAAALYQFGIEGANGVVWITTKRGQEGNLKVNLQARTAFNQPTRRMSFLNSYDYASLYNEAYSNDRGYWLAYYDNDALDKYQRGTDPVLYPNVDWYDEVVGNGAPYYDVNVLVRGGSSNVKYAVSLGYQDSELIYNKNPNPSDKKEKRHSFTKYNFRANTDVKINDIFSVSADLGGAISDNVLPAYSTNSLWQNLIAYPANIYPVKNPDKSWGGDAVYTDNPLASIHSTGVYTNHERIVQANVKLMQNMDFLLKGLNLVEAVSFSDYYEGYYNQTKDYERKQVYLDSDGQIAYLTLGQNSDYTITDKTRDVWQRVNYYLSADYSTKINRNSITAKLAFKQDLYKIDGRASHYFKQGLFGFIRYDYNKKYFSEFGYSYSGSENFKKGKRFGFFPTISAAWMVSEENFFKKFQSIDYLKLRASSGIVGNDNIGERFLYQSYYAGNSSNAYIFGTSGQVSQNYISENVVGNSNITWEKNHKTNIGLDLGIWENLSASLDFFIDKRTDIIAQRSATIPSVYGGILPYENIGKVTNKGFEFELGYWNKIGDFSYAFNGIFSFARNRIDRQEEPIRSEDYLYRTGKPIGQPFGFEWAGFYDIDDFDTNGNLIIGIPIPSYPVQPGDLRYVDQNKDGYINDDDVKAIGYSNIPEITYSLGVDFKYKSFDLSLFFQGVGNRSMYLNGVYAWAFINNTSAPQMAKGRWAYFPDQDIDTRNSATYPRLTTENNENNYTQSTFWTKNGGFLRLKTAEIGYSLPSKFMQMLKITECRLFIGGTNILTWDKIKDYDPEVVGGYPLTKSFYTGVNLNF